MPMKEGLFFDRVLGHEKAKRLLDLAIKNPQHGYVITGPDGTGVHALAEAFVRRLADEYNGDSLSAHPDILILQREPSERGTGLKKEISVAAVRELKVRVAQSPSIASRLVVYIPDADHLNEEGVNALLKCIEEPTVPAVYVMAAHAVGRLPATLLSRMREVRLDRVSEEMIRDWLMARGVAQDIAVSAACASDGRPGYADVFARDPEYRRRVEEAERTIRNLLSAESSGMMVAAVSKAAAACDEAEDTVAEWRNAIQLWQASLRRSKSTDARRVHAIGRALIAAERALGSSIPPRLWLEFALVNGFRREGGMPSLLLPRPFPFLPDHE